MEKQGSRMLATVWEPHVKPLLKEVSTLEGMACLAQTPKPCVRIVREYLVQVQPPGVDRDGLRFPQERWMRADIEVTVTEPTIGRWLIHSQIDVVFRCTHCDKLYSRSRCFVLQHPASGKTRMVHEMCLCDMTGNEHAASRAGYYSALRRFEDETVKWEGMEADDLAVKGVIEGLLGALNPAIELEIRPTRQELLDPRRSAELRLRHGDADGLLLGFVGELTTASLDRFDLRGASTAAELRLAALEQVAALVPKYEQPPVFPAVARDLNLVVDEAVSWADLAGTIRQASAPQAERVPGRLSRRRASRSGQEEHSPHADFTFPKRHAHE